MNAYQQMSLEIQNISIPHSFLNLNWDDICRECQDENPIIENLQKGKVLLKYPEAIFTDDPEHNKRIFFANFFGGKIFLQFY